MKGVILAGGFGTRLQPFTLKLNKGMAPIYTPEGAIPQLLFPLKTLTHSGITDILIITSREHCGHIVELLGDGTDYNCKLTYKIQEMNRPVVGIAQALGLAKAFVKDGPFAVILGDNFYETNFFSDFSTFSLLSNDNAMLFLKPVNDPNRFGVATVDDDNKITSIVEKPENPESNLAVTGLYLYTDHVFSLLPQLKPSKRNELEITDINNYYVKNNKAYSIILDSFWCDMGVPKSAKIVSDYLWSCCDDKI